MNLKFKVNFEKKDIIDYIFITIGCFITAISLVSFMIPNNIIAGGVSGLAIIVYRTVGLTVGFQMLFYNVILFLLGFLLLGIGFGIKSIYSAVILSLLIEFLQGIGFPAFHCQLSTADYLLIALYSGVIAGAGMGIVMWRGASTGGTDIVAMIINKYLHISTGSGLLLTDSIITALAIIIFGPFVAMYGIITIFTTSKMIDAILEGVGTTRTAFIISEKLESIKNIIMEQMERGATIFDATGAYTNLKKPVLMVSVRRREISQIRRIVKNEDKKAFMIVVNNSEVFGEGFKNIG
jgi:uncharacterized membrane-anchored protein YitT (DUF2179 family)